ncbi:microtubule-actin cross-linking factor 1 isoform X5 [Fundulus heteroclitus]|uniref:microtubule-actin cross-linking factor 1 isoform X5 n=1 Tax=Fundulus heteroclitus TaxID=8078 RepID=UPI00165C9829|nr:microtubule-actin cross-linking factor 1 isoform X5 [Fundulus heteroclitus]
MGNSMGCVRPLREADPDAAPTLSPKKRLRFRRKQKGNKNRRAEEERQNRERRRGDEPDEERGKEEGPAEAESIRAAPESRLSRSRTDPPGSTLSPGAAGGLLSGRRLEVTPKPSPAWRGVFCLPGEEDTVSAIVDVSSIPSQTTTTTPVNTAPALGSTTPGGGRVCRVREKVQGVLEKPWIHRRVEEEQDGGGNGTRPAAEEHKGVVHIREVDGKLCVVRTVYPSDLGSPLRTDEDVHREPPGNVLKVQTADGNKSPTSAGDSPASSTRPDAMAAFRLDPQGKASLLESGYSSDLPLTSPETAGTTPSQADWGGLAGSSSERLDSMAESPLAPQRLPAAQHLPQISEIYVCGESADLTAKEKLLLWSQQATEGYPGLRCTNFSSSWRDGRMFNALLHRYRPDLIDMEAVARQSNHQNLEQAFEIAESLGVTRLLDAEDVDVPSPDEKSVITYVSSIYDAFPKIPEGGEGIAAHEVDQRWSEYRSGFSSLLQWCRQQAALMAHRNFPQNPVELKALYNEYIHFKETEIPAKEAEKSHIEHLYKLLEVWVEFGRIKLPHGLHPNELEEEWGKLILEMLEREKALRPAVERVELLLQRANKIQNTAVDCEEKLTLAKNTLQADMSRAESGEAAQCEGEMACYLQDCEALIRQNEQDLKILREEKYYQVDQLAFRVSRLQEELVSLRLQCASVYRKGHFSQALGPTATEPPWQRATDGGLSLGQTLLGAVGAAGAALLRRPTARSQLVAMSSSEDEGSLRFIYELLGWVEETQELLEGAEWGADLASVEKNLQEHNTIHTAVEELQSSLQEARSYEAKVSPNFKGSYSETLAKLEHQYCKLLEHSSCRLQSLESLHAFVSRCTEELIWLNEREEEEISFDWSHNNTNMAAKREMYEETRSELAEKQEVIRSLQETAAHLCEENHPAKQTVEAYSAALQTQWQWVEELCVCVEQHLKDNAAYFQFMSDAKDCESFLRQLQETIKRQYTCDKNSRLSKLEDLLQDSMEEKEQLIEYRSTVASLVGRAKTVVQLRLRSAETRLGGATPVKAVCDYKQIETNVQITINRGEECVLQDNSQRTKWKVISPTGNEAMVPSVCFTVPPPNQEAIDTSNRVEQLYQKAMSLWHQLHVNMKSVVTWHYLLKDIRTVSGWTLDTVRSQSPSERQHALDRLGSLLADFLSDSKESSLFTAAERRELERQVEQAQQHCQDLLRNMETVEKDESVSRSFLSELQDVGLRLNEAERRLTSAIETPPPGLMSGAAGGLDNTLQIAEQEKLKAELDALRSSLGDVSRRCVRFFEEKPASSGVPVLRSELRQAVDRTDKLHSLSAVYLEKLKSVDLLMRSLEEAESQVRKYEGRLSEEDVVPADPGAIQSLIQQLGRWQAELSEQEDIFQALQVQVGRAKEAGAELSKLHPDRSPELERYQERANQMAERWSGIKRQTETRRSDLEVVGSALQQYRDNHSALIRWIDETTERQESAQPGQTDSRALSEQLAQQTALVAEIEQNQTKLDECQTYSKQYCTSVKDYELQLMTYRAFVESIHKSPVKRRRMHSSSDAITQEFMDLRTRYTALVTLTTQHVKYISDALRRLEEEEKEVEEEKQARVGQVSELLGWVKGLQGRTGGPSAESSLAAQQAISEQLAGKKDQVAEAIRSTQVFLCSKQASKLSPEERAQVEAQLDELTSTYNQLRESSTQQLQQLEQQLAKEEERKAVQLQKAECSQKLEGLNQWLAGAAGLLASQRAGSESGDVGALQERQKRLQDVQRDLRSKAEGVAQAVRSVEEFLAEKGDGLSPEERKSLQAALGRLKEEYGALTDSANASLAQLDAAISTTVQQNTQRARAVEELQETQTQIDSLLSSLSSSNQADRIKASGDVQDSPSSPPEGAVASHTEKLQAELQQLQAQQAQLLQVSQAARSLLEQPDATVPPEEKQRLRAALDQLQAQHQDRLQSCQERLRKSEALKDELTKFLQEHGTLGSWLEQSEQELRSLGDGETDAQGLKDRLEEHRKLGEDVICHKADLRFVSISGQKVLDSVQGALEQAGGSDPALEGTKRLVSEKLQDANHRYTTLHTKSAELGGRLSGLLERYQQYQDEVVSLHSWLSAHEQNQSATKSGGDTDPQNLQNALRQVQLLQDELAERSVQLEKVTRAGRDLVSADESPSLKAVDILCAADGLAKRFGSLSASVSERAERLQTAVAQSVSVQEGLKGLLSWLDALVLNPGPVKPTAQAVQDALTQNQKLRQELLSRQGSVEATRDSVSRLLQSSDASAAPGLHGNLDELTRRYAAAQASQAAREAELKGLLPALESYERLGADLQAFTQSRLKALSPAGQPDRSVDDYRQTVEEVKSELEQEAGQLKSFCSLGTELSRSEALSDAQNLLDNVRDVSDGFTRLEEDVSERFAAIQACEQQLLRFRGLSGSLARWLQTAQDQLPAKEASLNTEGLQRRVQQLQDLLNDWDSQGSRIRDLNKTGSELESLIIDVTAPQSRTGVPHMNGSAGPSSLNGIHTCKDLTELQVTVSDVNARYDALGADLKERLGRQRASLELRQTARQNGEELRSWLSDRESSLTQGHTASPSKPEAARAQAEQNKALLSELAEHSGKVEELKSTLRKLIAENPDSPEADAWREQLQEIDSRWQAANQTAAQRQAELETCADRLGSFASAAGQLGPWLTEKELMMSVLGPLSIDPNMLNTQKQQVQFMLREFDTRRPQFDQLTRSARGILSQTADSTAQDQKDLEEVRAELGAISQQWEDLTGRLTQRSSHIDQAQGTSERYQALLRDLASSVASLSERLDGQASLSARPEALRRRLQETGEVRSELERRRSELAEAERLCGELSAIVAEPYLKEELKKRLEGVSGPLRSLEERAADGLAQLQAALSSTQQFQQMFEELRSWLDRQSHPSESPSDSLPCRPDAVRSLLAQTQELQRAVASQRGSYELIQAEGVSLLATLPADERAALQPRLASLRQDWEGLNQRITERETRLRNTLSKAETYQQHKAELMPWLAECEEKDGEIRPSLDPSVLEDSLQKARALSLDLERRQPLLEAFNAAADQLLEQCCVGEEELRDEKAQLNRRLDSLSEGLLNRTSQLEELSSRLKEFEEGRQAVERRLEAAKHQIEVQEALGPQACSAKSLERLRNQQESLRSLQPQVVYLKDLAQGLVQDAPRTPGGSAEGAQRLQVQAKDTEKDYAEVTDKIEQCCSSLESRLQGVGEVQAHVRDVFSRLADLDDELDSLSPVGRDADSLASQADAVKSFLSRLSDLRTELDGHAAECTSMLRREGSSPDLLALRRETEALSRQAGKLSERGQARLGQIEDAAEKVQDFYRLVAELQGMLGRAEEGLNSQGAVGTEVEAIKQQLQELKAVEREPVDGIQPKLQHVNAVGQGLIQSAAKHTDTQALEHDLETTNLRWNSLNKRVAERIAQLQEALLHCGKFQDALEPLLSWLSDTEELVANQRPPSAEYRVVKAQIQEQKLLQRLLDDRRPTVEMIRAEGARIAATADSQDREKIQSQLQSLTQRWSDLLDKASGRQRQLEELQVLALHFHEALEPLGEWLSATEKRLSSAEPMGTQTAKISQQIVKHKALQEDVSSREAEVDRLESLSQSLSPLSCAADRDWLRERVGAVRSGHSELADWCARRAAMLDQALANAQLFGEEEVEVLNWLAEVAQRLAQVSVQSYLPQPLAEQHKHTLALNEEILSRKKTVDQAIKNGQSLLKQTTGEEVLLIQEKLDGIKSRYAEMTAGSSKALRTLEQALQLSTRFATAHDDINQWLDGVEAELNNVEPDASPAYQERQKELKKVSAEKRLVLDTVNEVGSALLDLVPWRAREGLDRLVADANQRYRHADETITQRVQLVQAAIQRSQQYEEAVDAELAWVGETERKLASLGPLSLEPDVTVAQLQVQRAFNIDIIRHKDTVDQLLGVRDEVLEACSEAQKDALTVKTDSLSARYEAVSQSHSERFSALEQAQVLVARFWETFEELEPWLGETEALIAQLPPPAIDTDALRLQQDQMRLLRESIAEHKPHIDKLLKIGPQLAELSLQEGATVRQRYTQAERRYLAIKEEVKGRATGLDEAVSQSAQLVEFHDKMDPLLETLEGAVQRLRQPPPVAAEVEKIREQLAEHRAQGLELDKLLPSFSALCSRGEELIGRAAHDDPAAQAVRSRLLRLRSLWDEIRQRAEERESKLNDVLDLAGKFWADVAALLSTLRDSQDIVRELEDPGVDPSLIKQQIEAAEAIKAETDGLREELEFVRTLGADLIFACGETEKPEVKKTIDEMNGAWEGLNRTWRERMERLEEAMTASVQYQDALQSMFDYLDNAVIKLCDMSTVGTDLGTVKQQIEELKQYKVDVYQQQIDMEKLCHQGELLLKKVSDQTDRDMIQEPLTELRHLWENLGDKITQRQHKLEGALLALGQFQHALSELQAWLSHTHTTLDTQRPVSSDPKAIEIELAKHHVLRNDVLSHHATVETVNSAAAELLESSPGDEASHLRDQLDQLNRSWESLLLKTQERQKLLEAALQQAEGFHGELEEFLQWLRRTDSQLSAAKPTGGLPETAREQLQQHLELQAQLSQRAEQYHHLLDQGESMLLARGGEEAGPGTTQTQQNLAMLQNKWASLNTKMDDRRVKLEEAVSLATGFQTSLQDTINWLTQAEQTLNMAQPPSLILDTVLFQIDEHKVFVNEVNTHREQVLALEKAGSQLRFASLKQDVVLIKNLLLSVQARWDKLVQRSLDRGRHLDEARKRAKQFHEAWRKLTDWLEEAEKRLDSEVEISNEPDKIKVQLTKHKEFQKALGSKQPVYDTTVRSGKAMRDKAQLPADQQKLDHLVGEVRDKWDTVCGKSVERQHKLEEALLFSGQFAEALQALVDWLYRVEPQLAEDQPVHGDMDLVSNLMDAHKAFQKELGKRTGSVQALKRSARDLMETGRDDTAWVKVQLQELSNRWDTVCALSVTKQTRLQQALKQAEEFRTAVQMLLEWLSEAEQTLRFRGVLPEEAETLQALLHTHRDFMGTVEEKRTDVNKAAGMGEGILTVCHPDSITTIKHWITIIRARFEEVLTWAKQHEQRLETALTEVLNNANLLEELLSWLQWAETTLVQRDTEPLPQDIPQLKTLITEHQTFMEEMTRKQPDVDKVTKSYKRKPAEPPSSLAERRGARKHQQQQQQQQQPSMQVSGGNPRLTQLCARWQQVWLLALDRQRKLNDALDRQEELREFANFDFDVWRKKYMRWMNHKKSRVMDFFRRIDKDQDGKITRQEFIDGILASKFPTSKLEMSAVADIFDRDGDGYIDYYEFVAALHPNKDAYRPTTDADKIEDEVTRQVAQCKCAKRFQVEQIGENKYRFFLGNQFGDSQQLRLVRILRSTVMVRVGGGWMALDEFLVKNDPCRARGRTNLELREKFILPEGASQGLAAFRSRGRRSKPGSRNASPTRSSSSASHSGASLPSAPSTPATPTASASSRSSQTHSRDYAKPWLAHSKTPTPSKCHCCPDLGLSHSAPGHEGAASGSKLKRPTFHSSRGSLTGENGGTPHGGKRTDPKRGAAPASGPTSRAGSRAGSRASSRRGSDASDASELQDARSVCSDTSDTPRRPGSAAKPSKIPTISKKAPSPKGPGSTKK